MNDNLSKKQKYFLDLYEPISSRVSKYIKSQVWNNEDARDIASETVMIAWQKVDKIQSAEVFLYYLFSIASRLIRQRYRKQQLWKLFRMEQLSKPEITSHISETALDMDVLYKALQRLSAKEREAIMMFEISGLNLKEIQEIQEDSLSAVKSRITRGRVKLAKMIGDKKIHVSFSSSPKDIKSGFTMPLLTESLTQK
jgi:RNA polymerase sigma-70 factor (ECF subfamily)